jgi:hypothetical protein
MTFIDLEFDTGTKGSALLGDIASSLVSIDELLRDLASIAAYPSTIEFRKIEIVAIELRNPLRVKLSLFAISPDAVKAFQEICHDIIRFRERESEEVGAKRLAGLQARITEKETQRLHGHILTLQNAEVPLRRVEVKEE